MVFLVQSLTIAFVNTILSGDNGVMVAFVMKSLPSHLRRRALITATICDVIARTTATAFAIWLLRIPLLKCLGGLLIVYLSLRLFRQVIAKGQRSPVLTNPWTAAGFVVSADLVMSADNTVAIAGIAAGHLVLLFAGFALSIPVVFFASQFVCKGMERYPVLVYLGAGVLAVLGGRMIASDPLIERTFHLPTVGEGVAECVTVLIVLTAGYYIRARSKRETVASVSGERSMFSG